MKIAVVGTGYVGLVVGACLAEAGNEVACLDLDEEKIAGLRRYELPIYEPGLQEIVSRNQAAGRLVFTTNPSDAVRGSSVAFIAVGTPPGEDGSADLRHVLAVAEMLGQEMDREIVIVTKSTVPVGTAAMVAKVVRRTSKFPFHMCSNPEFLKEGAAVEDFLRPDRVVLGAETDFARSLMTEIYAPFLRTGKPIIFMDIPSAELTKYAANGMLATRISFMNEISNLCEKVGADVELVRRGIGADSRIGSSFLFPGPGYGGSCFPKDVNALVSSARNVDTPLLVLEAVERANQNQKSVLYTKAREAVGGSVTGKHFALWGLSFKAQTDDMRESPSLTVIDQLLNEGATITAHDPAAMPQAQRTLGDRIRYAPTSYEALVGARALIIATDWSEYRHPSFERILETLADPVIIDGRNLYDPRRMKSLGFNYVSMGRP